MLLLLFLFLLSFYWKWSKPGLLLVNTKDTPEICLCPPSWAIVVASTPTPRFFFFFHIKQFQSLLAIEKTDFSKSILILCKIIHVNRKSLHFWSKICWVFFLLLLLQMTDGCSPIYDRVYLPQMCSINTEAMNRRLITSTGTGPTLSPGESSV